METIFRDDRFPDVEIRNHGRCTFHVWERGEVPNCNTTNAWSYTDCFMSHEDTQTHKVSAQYVSAQYAAEVAQCHFDHMAEKLEAEGQTN